MTTQDPYPEHLEDIDDAELGFAPSSGDALVRAMTRLAVAIENATSAFTSQRQAAPAVPERPPLAPLPPVQTVATTPPCPNHGLDKVKPSTKFAGFYCTAKDPNGPRGYCPWQFRTAA